MLGKGTKYVIKYPEYCNRTIFSIFLQKKSKFNKIHQFFLIKHNEMLKLQAQ